MGQLEKYGLYVLCLVIFLILGVAIWGGEPEAPILPNNNVPLEGADNGKEEVTAQPAARTARFSSGSDAVNALLSPVTPPLQKGRNLPPRQENQSPEPKVEDPPPSNPPASDRRVYVVKKGDILGEIALRELGSSKYWPAIMKLNPGLDPKRMKPGEELLLPAPGSLGQEAAAAGDELDWKWHTVAKGESFYTISKKLYGTVSKMSEIQALNPRIDPRKLKEGMEIKVPSSR